MKLASRQAASRMHIPEAIERFWDENDYAPTVRELAEMIGHSVGYTHAALLRLKADAIVLWTPGAVRTLRVER